MTPTNFSKGLFKFKFQQDGNFVLYTQNAPYNSQYEPYFGTGTWDDGNPTNIGYQVIFNETGYLYVLKVNNESIVLTPRMEWRAADYYTRATLDYNGVFTQYYHPRNFTGNPGWSPLWWKPINICNTVNAGAGSGACDEDQPTSLYDFKELIGTYWPNSEYDLMDPISEEECRSSCATDCFCTLAFYQGTTCWKKQLPFTNGRKDSQINGKAFLK